MIDMFRLLLILTITGLASARLAAAETVPLTVGTRACLFLDDRFVAEQSGLKRTWHPGRPREDVAIRATEPWEKWTHLFGSVFRDPKDGLFKMYYESAIMPSRIPGNSFTCFVLYAESIDGKSWTKPRLRLYEDLGSKENNIAVFSAEFPKVFLDPRAKDPAERLKMFVYLANGGPHGGTGECLMSSSDGMRWKLVGGFSKPSYAKPEQGDFTDSQCFQFDPIRDRYMAYVRTFSTPANGIGGCRPLPGSDKPRRRAVGISVSNEINRNWSPIEHVLEPDDRDDAKVAPLSKDQQKPDWAEHYCMPIFTCGNHYIGLLSLLYYIDGSDFQGGGDLQLTFSHDGRTWHRQPQRESLIAPSNAAPQLFPTYASSNGPIEIGDEWWLYYTEANGGHPLDPFERSVSQIRAAVWRRDGFVSLDAGEQGMLTTPPMNCGGGTLLLNVKASEGGSVRAALLDEGGKPLPGFDLSDCDPLTGDHVRGIARWRGKSDLAALVGKPVRLKLELTKCSLYSIRFSAEAPVRIVCLGDSVTRATSVRSEQTFCSQVESRLRASGREATVINSGVGSDTTSGGLARFDRDVLAHNPTHVFIMFGLNDAYRPKPDAPPLVGLAQYSANLREMIARLRDRGITPIVMTSNPFLPHEKNVELKSYVEAARKVARDERVALVDVFARFAELSVEGNQWQQVYSDGDCHLNLEGNSLLAKLMMSSFEP